MGLQVIILMEIGLYTVEIQTILCMTIISTLGCQIRINTPGKMLNMVLNQMSHCHEK